MLKKKIILHPGLQKTGSTFIQEHLKSKNFNECKIFLPDSQIAKLLQEYLENSNIGIKEKIQNIIKNEKSKKIFLSSEGILGHQHYHYKDISKRFQLLEDLFDNPKYIIFFREPSSIIYSGYLNGLQKSYSLKFENYIDENKNDPFNRNFYNEFVKGLDYKIYNYNNIFKDFLNIQKRVLFVDYEDFFKKRDVIYLENFFGFNLQLNFERKINKSIKNLIYYEIFEKLFFFKYIKIIWIQFNKLFFKYKTRRDISLRVVVLINFLKKFIPQKHFREIDEKHQSLLKKIKNYHSKDYKDFKDKIDYTLHKTTAE